MREQLIPIADHITNMVWSYTPEIPESIICPILKVAATFPKEINEGNQIHPFVFAAIIVARICHGARPKHPSRKHNQYCQFRLQPNQ